MNKEYRLGFIRMFLTVLTVIIAILVFFSGLSVLIHTNTASPMVNAGPKSIILPLIGSITIYRVDPAGAVSFLAEYGPAGLEGYSNAALMLLAASAVLWLILFFIVTSVIRLFFHPKTTVHGSARWLRKSELKKQGLLQGYGVVLGQTADARYIETSAKKPKKRKDETRRDYRDRLRLWNRDLKGSELVKPGKIISQSGNAHTLIVGSTRSGKGVSCIIPTEFRWPESMIVLDPKGEGWYVSAAYRSRFSYTFRFEPERPEGSIHYNPLLSIRRGRHAIPDIQNLAYILIPGNEGAKDPFWDNEARKLFAAVMGYVVFCEEPKNKTFAKVYSIFSNSEALSGINAEQDSKDQLSATKKYLNYYAGRAREYIKNTIAPPELKKEYAERDKLPEKERKAIEDKMAKYLSDDDAQALTSIQHDLEYFAACEDKQLSSVVSTMLSQLQVIADPNVQEVTSRSDFTMYDFINGVRDEKGNLRPVSMYMIVSLSSMKRLIPLINIFYSQAITLLAQDNESKKAYRLLLIFDEFRQLGKMETVERALSLTAGYGILCMIVIQSFDQLRMMYQSAASLIDNFAYQVVLRVTDEETSQKIERILGNETLEVQSFSRSAGGGTRGDNLSFSETGKPLMTSAEIRAMDENECIIIHAGSYPYRAKKNRYYLDDRFRRFYLDKEGKKLPPPPLSENLPHPEAGDKGIDDNGWNKLLGVNAYQVTESERKKDEAELRGKAESKKETAPDPKKAVSVEDEINARKERDEMKRAAEANLIMYVTQIYESEECEADARLYMQQSGMDEADIERLLVDIRRIWRQNAAR